jgi:hypothetical protein
LLYSPLLSAYFYDSSAAEDPNSVLKLLFESKQANVAGLSFMVH